MSLFRSSWRKSRLALVVVTAVAMMATVLLVQNWTGAEKKIEQKLPRLYEMRCNFRQIGGRTTDMNLGAGPLAKSLLRISLHCVW